MRNTDLTSADQIGLEAALEEYTAGSGARSAALVDGRGGVIARTGLPMERAADLAVQATRLHATARRIDELAGAGEARELVAVGAGGRLTVREIGKQGGAVLLLSFTGPDADAGRVSQAVETLRGAVERPHARLGPPAALEDTMLERLDHTFPAE